MDQWIETGGTMKAAIKLVERQGATVVGESSALGSLLNHSTSVSWVPFSSICSIDICECSTKEYAQLCDLPLTLTN